MSKNKFKVADRVAYIGNDYNGKPVFPPSNSALIYNSEKGLIIGTVIRIDSFNNLEIKWDKSFSKNLCREYELEEVSIIKEKLNEFEIEFQTTKTLIEVSLKNAADSINYAAKLAADSNQNLTDLNDELDPLFKAMDEVGWRTSSLTC